MELNNAKAQSKYLTSKPNNNLGNGSEGKLTYASSFSLGNEYLFWKYHFCPCFESLNMMNFAWLGKFQMQAAHFHKLSPGQTFA